MDRFTDKLLEDSRFLDRLLDFLGENLTMDKPDGTNVPLKTVITRKGNNATTIRIA